MSKPTSESIPTGVGAQPAKSADLGNRILSHPAKRRRPIRVMMFHDRRCSDDLRTPGRLHQLSEIASHQGAGKLPVDRLLITGLFRNVLERVGCDTNPKLNAGVSTQDIVSLPVVLEGYIWSLSFQTGPTPLFDIDLSLALSDPQTSTVLWQTDFPMEDNLPIWIGLGCRSEDMLSMALAELEAVALVHFRSVPFLEAVGVVDTCPVPASDDCGGSHKVVAASSWTGTDEGKITATAYESGSSTPVGMDRSGSGIRESVTRKRSHRHSRAGKVVGAA